jgi:catechol 2,3-dioxygenase-like lactoylglutathione lyase family enzyme
MRGPLLDEDKVMQICFVTDNLEKSAKWFADLLGESVPKIGKAAEPEEAQATYRGKPATLGCRLVLFKFGNIDVEFLEPDARPSAWRDFLEKNGPSVHHIAFKTRNLTEKTRYLESRGLPLLQRGEFDGGGGRYAYFDTEAHLGTLVELLEFDKDRVPM